MDLAQSTSPEDEILEPPSKVPRPVPPNYVGRCQHDRVHSGWDNVGSEIVRRMGLSPEDMTILDIGTSNGRKSVEKYIKAYGIRPENVTGIEIQDKFINAWKERIPAGTIHKLNVARDPLDSLPLGTYHIILLCEILEHIGERQVQYDIIRESAMFVKTGGGIHVTFPLSTKLDSSPWGHKCGKVDRNVIYDILAEYFNDVSWALSINNTVNLFAVDRK